MDYIVVNEGTIEEVVKKVNQRIRQGYEPIGGIAITLSESDEYSYFDVAQAMVKKEIK